MRSRCAASIALAALAVLLASCSKGGGGTVENPTPIIGGLFPDSATANGLGPSTCASGPMLNLNVTSLAGFNTFVETSVVQWNGSPRTTTFNVNTAQLVASILGCDLANPGTAQITVVNPTPGGGTSASVTFVINPQSNPVPSVSTLNPSNTPAGGPAFCLTVIGTNFVSNSTVAWNGSPRGASAMCSGASSTSLTVQISAADIANQGTAAVVVSNPAPGGGTSPPSTFTIGPAAVTGFPIVISVSASGGPADGSSSAPAMSADGRYVAFYSQAKNLVAEGASGNIFVRDTCLGATTDCTPHTIAVDLAPDGSAPNGDASPELSISANGRDVTFASMASNLTLESPVDSNSSFSNIYVRDLCIGSSIPSGCVPHTSLVSVDVHGAAAPGSSQLPSMSADGRFVAFASNGADLVSGLSDPMMTIFIRDTCIGPTATTSCVKRTTAVAIDSADQTPGLEADEPQISPDGRFVTFQTWAPKPGFDGQFVSGIFLRDTCAGPAAPETCVPSTTRVSLANDGSVLDGVNQLPSVSADGRFVAFQSLPFAGEENSKVAQTILLRDTCIGAAASDACTPSTKIISSTDGMTDASFPWISPSGRFITFLVSPKTPDQPIGLTSALHIFDTCLGVAEDCAPTESTIASHDAAFRSIPSVDLPSRVPLTPDGRIAAFFWSTPDHSLPSSGLGDVFLTAAPTSRR
ncbi:MAG: hypothetical protein WBP79_06890 [Candidatus Acidiferrales bacterium]